MSPVLEARLGDRLERDPTHTDPPPQWAECLPTGWAARPDLMTGLVPLWQAIVRSTPRADLVSAHSRARNFQRPLPVLSPWTAHREGPLEADRARFRFLHRVREELLGLTGLPVRPPERSAARRGSQYRPGLSRGEPWHARARPLHRHLAERACSGQLAQQSRQPCQRWQTNDGPRARLVGALPPVQSCPLRSRSRCLGQVRMICVCRACCGQHCGH